MYNIIYFNEINGLRWLFSGVEDLVLHNRLNLLIWVDIKNFAFSNSYLGVIVNYNYRGAMEIIPKFTIKELAEKIERSEQTARKWCHILNEEGKIKMGWKRSYFANDPSTYEVWRTDSKTVKLTR